MFDFTTETYSSLISIFSAVIGLGYPILLQSIQRIDEQYGSARLAYRFQQERSFKLFQIILFSNIIISILSPFVIYLVPNKFSTIVISIQTIFVLALLLSSFSLYNLIRIYYYPKHLIRRLEQSSKRLKPVHMSVLQKDENSKFVDELMNIFDISVYGAKKENFDFYYSAINVVICYFYEYQNESDNKQPLVYPKGFMQILRETVKHSTNEAEHTYFYTQNIITPLLYNSNIKNIISEDTHRFLWIAVNDIIKSNNKGWFNQYWSWSDQYYNFVLLPIMTQEKYVDNSSVERFCEQHFMIGALLVYNKKYDWLRDIMYFTNQQPPKYGLIPGTFIKILNMSRKISLLSSLRHINLISEVYPFYGMNADVYTSYYVYNEALKYISLLVIRLFIFSDYNINNCNPMELPEPQRDINNNKDEIEMVQSIISGINYWYDENTINMIHFNSIVPEKSEVIEFLDSYVRLCKKVIDGIVENPQIDDKKISYIKNELFEYEKVNIENIVTDKSIFLNDLDINSYESRSFSLPYSYRLNKSDICEGYRGFIVDLKRILTQGLFNNLQRYYASFFINVKSCAEYSIQYSDMLKALNKLKLDSKQHVIFSQGVSFSDFELIYGSQENLKTCGRIMTYNNTQIINMPSQERLLLVMRKADVPFYNFQTKKDGGELSLKTICPNSFLYSNLDDLDLTDPILELVYYLNFYYKENFKYVRIKISNDFPVGNRGDIDKIRSFI